MMRFMAVLLPKELLSNFSVPALPFHPVALSVLFIVAKFSECTSLVFPSSPGIRIGKCYPLRLQLREETRWK